MFPSYRNQSVDLESKLVVKRLFAFHLILNVINLVIELIRIKSMDI